MLALKLIQNLIGHHELQEGLSDTGMVTDKSRARGILKTNAVNWWFVKLEEWIPENIRFRSKCDTISRGTKVEEFGFYHKALIHQKLLQETLLKTVLIFAYATIFSYMHQIKGEKLLGIVNYCSENKTIMTLGMQLSDAL